MEEDGIGVLGGEEERLLPCLCIMGRQDKEGFQNENENEFVCLKISRFGVNENFRISFWFQIQMYDVV